MFALSFCPFGCSFVAHNERRSKGIQLVESSLHQSHCEPNERSQEKDINYLPNGHNEREKVSKSAYVCLQIGPHLSSGEICSRRNPIASAQIGLTSPTVCVLLAGHCSNCVSLSSSSSSSSVLCRKKPAETSASASHVRVTSIHL